MTALSALPDSTPVYIDGHGQATLGEIRHAPEENPALDEWGATLDMYADLATRNLCRDPWDSGATPLATREYHASRYSNAGTRVAFT